MSWLGTVLKAVVGAVPIVGELVKRSTDPTRKLNQRKVNEAMDELRRREAAGSKAFQDVWDRHSHGDKK